MNLVDSGAFRRDLDIVAANAADMAPESVKTAVKARVKELLRDGRAEAEKRLLAGGRGVACAESLSRLEDDIVSALADFALRHVHGGGNLSTSERMAVVAVGGYGRGTLAPGSDIDLLFLLPYKQTGLSETMVETILYTLWDCGQKVGHATRSIDECIRLARSDITIRTALLEARLVWGEKSLFDELMRRFDSEVVFGSGPEFVAAKLAEREERHRKAGQSRYLVEPNVKDGKGGQRDLQTLYWIGKYLHRVRRIEDLVPAGMLDAAELARFRKCEEFQWRVRCTLHFLAGRPEERLSFDVQRGVAQRMGFVARAGQKDVERFMKQYFLVAKAVGDLTRIFSATLEERHLKPAPLITRLFGGFSGTKTPASVPGYPDYRLKNGRLVFRFPDVPEKDPVHLVRMFAAANALGVRLHPDTLAQATRLLPTLDRFRADPDANRLFMEVLTSRQDPETTLRVMNECGVLGRFIPDFGRIVAMMQFNMYHHYTVDEHLLRCIGILAAIENGTLKEDHPLAADLVRNVSNRRALYVALFLHDIAKGRPEDHSIAGVEVARRLCPRLGLTPAETETVVWLVREHLTMSTIAQSRDLSDPRTIEMFANIVQSPERLKLLLILTVADIRGVGPGVWNGWKGQLLRTLYYETEPVLAGGHSQVERKLRVKAAQDALAWALQSWTKPEIERHLARHYPAYWLRVDLERQVRHAELIRRAEAEGASIQFDIQTDTFRAITELTITVPDHPRLLSMVTGACAAANANIVDAQIFTTVDGRALDVLSISRAFPDEEDERRRAERIVASIAQALRGDIRLTQFVAERTARKSRPPRAFAIEPDVLVNNTLSDRFTVIEVSGLDAPISRSTSARPMSRPSASGWSTCST
jgi:[protein-PII] uridylyltransferase